MASDELTEEGFNALVQALASLSPKVSRQHYSSMLLAYNIARLLNASPLLTEAAEWIQAVTHYFHAFGQWNMSVDDHGAADAAAALVAFNEVMTWALKTTQRPRCAR